MLCPKCGSPSRPGFQYCGQCGQKLPGAPPAAAGCSALQGERKPVSVLFADISGFSAMIEQCDAEGDAERAAEDVVYLVNACLAELSQCVYRYGGSIDKYIGDAIMAVFGAPVAHEDDPVRAIRTALDMQEALVAFNAHPPRPLTIPLDIHIGINTGPVIAGLIGAEQHQEYTVMGDAVNLAKRLEDLAGRGQIFVSEDTYRLTSRLFEFNELGPVTIKGKTEPTRIYQVTGLPPQPGSMRGLSGMSCPLVGRRPEERRLSLALECLCRQAGRGGIVLVEGEAGIGKSRLVTEVRRKLQARYPNLRWQEGRGQPYGDSHNFHLLAGMLRQHLGLSEEMDDRQKWSTLCLACDEWFGARAEEVRPYLGMLLGLRLPETAAGVIPQANPQLLSQRLFSAFGEWASAVAARHPLVLAFDDMHWADANSIALIEYLMTLCRQHPLLILCVGRPERESPFWQVRQQAIEGYPDILVQLTLNPLSDGDVLTLLQSLLRLDRVPEDLGELILSRAEGNPLFAEEILRMLMEEGTLAKEEGRWRTTRPIQATHIPRTLEGVLLARLDRLDEATRRVVQAAAVIGRVFRRPVLARAMQDPADLDECLSRLQEAEILRQRSREPEPEYIFKHTLAREAAYRSLLTAQRKAHHERVADALARLFWERGEEDTGAGLVAAHYEQAEAWPRALTYVERAGDGARDILSNREAIDHYTRALEIADQLGDKVAPGQRLRLYEKRGELLARLGETDQALADYEYARQLAQQVGDRQAELRALNHIGELETDCRRHAQAGDHFNRALTLAQAIGDQADIGDSLNWLGNYQRTIGRAGEARACHSQALEIAHALDDNRLLADSLEGIGQLDFVQGQVRASLEAYERVRELRRRLVDRVGLMVALSSIARACLWLGDYPRAAEVCLEAFDFISRVGDLPAVASLHTYYAISCLCRGELGKVEDHLLAGLDIARHLEHAALQGHCRAWLSYYYLAIGQLEQALVAAEQAAALAHRLPEAGWRVRADACLAAVHLERQEPDQALELANQAYRRAAELESPLDLAVAVSELGRANLAAGRWESAAACMHELQDVANGSQLREYQLRARCLEGQLLLAQGQPGEALAALADARQLADAMGARLFLWPLEISLADGHQAAGRDELAGPAYQRAWATLQSIADTLPGHAARASMQALPLACRLQARLEEQA